MKMAIARRAMMRKKQRHQECTSFPPHTITLSKCSLCARSINTMYSCANLHQQIAIVVKSIVIATVRVAVSMLDVVVVVVLVAVVYHVPDICGGRNWGFDRDNEK